MELETPKEPAVNTPLAEADWHEWSDFVTLKFGAAVSGAALDTFKTLLAELKDWNSKMNLIAPSSDKRILWRHFADSLAGLTLIEKFRTSEAPKIIDIGAGAGFPGIPITLASRFSDLT